MPGSKLHLTTVFSVLGGKRGSFNLDFARDTDIEDAQVDEVLAAAFASLNASTGIKSVHPASITFLQCIAYTFEPEANPTPPPAMRREVLTPPRITVFSVIGTHTGTANPPQVSIGLTFRTATAGRSGRGRIYTPPPTQAVVTAGGIIDSTHRANVLAAYEDYISDIENAPTVGGDLTHCVWSSVDGASRIVTSVACKARVDTQRRRLDRAVDV